MWNLTRQEGLILLFLVSAFVVGLGIKLVGGIPQEIPTYTPPVDVKIEGAVQKEGWYKVTSGSTVKELITRAGGTLPWADLSEVDLSRPLTCKTVVYIPEGRMDLNRVSVEELTFLPGIGPELAERIIKYRVEKGGFKNLAELKKVSGIGDVRFEKIKDRLKVTTGGEIEGE